MSERSGRRGFLLLLTAVVLVALVGVLGLALDGTRLSITRQEAQTFSDAAALRAARELDGTAAGLARARISAAATPGRWAMGTRAFPAPRVEFRAATGAWSDQPQEAARVHAVRVAAQLDDVELWFLPVILGSRWARVSAASVAEVVEVGGAKPPPPGEAPLAVVASAPGAVPAAGETVLLRPVLLAAGPPRVDDRLRLLPGMPPGLAQEIKDRVAGGSPLLTVPLLESLRTMRVTRFLVVRPSRDSLTGEVVGPPRPRTARLAE